jgi:hypothetical protein
MVTTSGNQSEINWTGRVGVEPVTSTLAITPEDENGKPVPVRIGVGKIVPEDWIGCRVEITVKRLPPKDEINGEDQD